MSNERKAGKVVVAVAIIWGAVILATALVLQDAVLMGKMFPILGDGAAGCIIVVSEVLIERERDYWSAYYIRAERKRRSATDIVLPAAVAGSDLKRYLADLCHE